MRHPKYDSIVRNFVAWARVEPSARSALVVGSQARVSKPADDWSDLDLALFAKNPAALVDSTAWVEKFGDVVLTFVENTTVGGSRERRVLYAGGLDVDIAVFSVEALPFIAGSVEGRNVLARGYEVLLDKDGFWTGHPELHRPPPLASDRLPTPEAFRATADDFWYHVLWTAKKIRRGEIWTAKFCCDGYLKILLLRILEWQVLSSSGNDVDIWHNGRFLEEWVPSEILARIPATFATYELEDLERALEATGRLFSEVSRDLAKHLGHSYPDEVEARVWSLVAQLPVPSRPQGG